MVYTPTFRAKPAYLKVFTILARVVGVVFVLGGILFVLRVFVAATDKALCLAVAVFLIASGLGLIFARGPTVADNELWRRRIGFNEPNER